MLTYTQIKDLDKGARLPNLYTMRVLPYRFILPAVP